MSSLWPDWLPLRDSLQSLSPYGAPQIPDVIRLNTNENPFDVPASVVASMKQALETVLPHLNRYPDRDATQLRSLIADYINSYSGTDFTSSNIWAANGSNEILQTLMLACGGRGALGYLPSYSVHPLIARVTGTEFFNGARDEDFSVNIAEAIAAINQHRPSLVFVTTPNNPTGTAMPIADLEGLAIAAAQVDSLLVVDEAYAEFSDEISAVTLIARHPNVVVVRTMSKAFAFAGARVGYLIARPEVVDAALITRLPYHLSAPTQALAIAALQAAPVLLAEVEFLKSERARVVSGLQQLGLFAAPSSANFLIFRGFTAPPAELWQALVEKGVLVRDIGIDGYLRVTIGTASENDAFLVALQQSI
jgi:histidinol-phosphate aminotransferase